MNSRLRIGLFIDTFFPMIDGVVMVVDNYARRLTRYCDVTVFAPESADPDYVDDFPYRVVRCKALSLNAIDYELPLPHLDRAFQETLDELPLDLVHIHSPFMVGRMGLHYAREHGIPVVATMHSQYKQDFQRALKLQLTSELATRIVVNVFDRCDECWAVNAAIADIFYRDYGCRERPKVQDNATDMEPVPDPAAARQTVREAYGIDPEARIFLFVGRINKLKNVLFLADALKILADGGLAFRMLFVGEGQDQAELEEQLVRDGIRDRVTFCGRLTDREQLARHYAAADLFLFPSLYDASSLVQIEAASQHLPTVFLEGAATANGVVDGENGFLSPAEPAAYADTVRRALDPAVLDRVREGAFRQLYHSFDDVVAQVYRRYEALVDARDPLRR